MCCLFNLYHYQWLELQYTPIFGSTAGTIQQYQTSSNDQANNTAPAQNAWILCIFYYITIIWTIMHGCRNVVLTILHWCRLVYCYYYCTVQYLQCCCIYISILTCCLRIHNILCILHIILCKIKQTNILLIINTFLFVLLHQVFNVDC